MATFAVVNRSQGDKHATTRQLRMLFDQRFLLTAHYIQINHRDALYSYQEKKIKLKQDDFLKKLIVNINKNGK